MRSVLFLLAVAVGALPPSAPVDLAALRARAASADDLRLGGPRRTEAITLEVEGLRFELGEGVLSPILFGGAPERPQLTEVKPAEDPALQAEVTTLGFVWTGEGRVHGDLTPEGAGRWLANWQRRVLGEAAPGLDEGRLTQGVEALVLFGGEAARLGFIEALSPGRGGGGHAALLGDAELSRREATRLTLLRDALSEPDERLPLAITWRADAPHGVSPRGARPPGRQSWWRWARSATDPGVTRLGPVLDERRADMVALVRRGESAPRVRPVYADATLSASPSADALYLDVEVEATLTLRAEADLQHFVLHIPVEGDRPDSVHLQRLHLPDGRRVSFSGDPRGRVSLRSLDVVLPEVVPAGQELVLEVAWRDAWHLHTSGARHAATGLMDVLPHPYPLPVGQPQAFTLRVELPADAGLQAAVSGPTASRSTPERGVSVVEVVQDAPALWPSVSIGRWAVATASGTGVLPALSVGLAPDKADSLGGFVAETARVISAFTPLVGPYPFSELEVAQAPSSYGGFTWIAPHGLINVQQGMAYGTSTFREDRPHLEQGILAHELAHGWFGHVVVPASREDFWIAESFSEALSCVYLASAFGEADCAARLRRSQRTWLDAGAPASASLTMAYDLFSRTDTVYGYGLYVVHHALRGRVGDEAWVQALRALMGDGTPHTVTTADVQAAFEAASGQDLSDFFDFWVRGGFIPEELEVRLSAERRAEGWFLVGEARADVARGVLDVQLQVRDGEANYSTPWVMVRDGAGAFELGPFPGEARPVVMLDPADLTLARSKRLRWR